MAFTILSLNTFFNESFMKLHKANITFDGLHGFKKEVDHYVVVKPDAVCVTAYDPRIDSFVFVEQFRSGAAMNASNTSPFLIEPVAGHIDGIEDPVEAAVREVGEETDSEVNKSQLVFLCKGYTSPGFSSEIHHHYYTEIDSSVLDTVSSHGIDDEDIRIRIISRLDTLAMIDSGEIQACNTILGVSMAIAKGLVPSAV